MSSISFIINPVSGTGKAKKIPAYIEAHFKQLGRSYNIRYTEYAQHAKLLVAEELEKGSTTIVAVGGDGTVNEIGAALLNTNGTLGIIPTGSGNGLARHLNISMNPSKAIETAISGQAIKIDCGELNGRPFFCTAGMGFDAVVAKRFSVLKGRGLFNYIVASLKEYRNFKPEKVRDQNQNEYNGFLLSFCNANQYGNNAYICPDANISDGQLNLIEVPLLPLVYIPVFISKLLNRNLRQGKYYRSIPFSKMSLHKKTKGALHIDGEPIEDSDKIEIKCLPQSLSIMVPSK